MNGESCWRCGAQMKWVHGTWQCGVCRFKLGCCEGEPQTGCETTAVRADDSDAEPKAFVAVTRERSVEPASSASTVWLDPSPTWVHDDSWQRSHTNLKVIGVVPLHSPVDEVSVRPTRASPLTTG